jgi:hypothetical protein
MPVDMNYEEWWSGGATYEEVEFDGKGKTCVIRV